MSPPPPHFWLMPSPFWDKYVWGSWHTSWHGVCLDRTPRNDWVIYHQVLHWIPLNPTGIKLCCTWQDIWLVSYERVSFHCIFIASSCCLFPFLPRTGLPAREKFWDKKIPECISVTCITNIDPLYWLFAREVVDLSNFACEPQFLYFKKARSWNLLKINHLWDNAEEIAENEMPYFFVKHFLYELLTSL